MERDRETEGERPGGGLSEGDTERERQYRGKGKRRETGGRYTTGKRQKER
jgi:hypothetical protein